jgi:aspartyl-tRNA(Asn)/glutamyl-tRNA(Gln) amidotransferase subunit B
MVETGKAPEKIVEEKGLMQISDEGALKQMVDEVIAKNPQAVEDFKAGKEKAIGALVGQVMKASKGKANPGVVNQLLRDALSKL